MGRTMMLLNSRWHMTTQIPISANAYFTTIRKLTAYFSALLSRVPWHLIDYTDDIETSWSM